MAGGFDSSDEEHINEDIVAVLFPDVRNRAGRGNRQKIRMRHRHSFATGKHDIERDERRSMPVVFQIGRSHRGR